MKPRPAMRLPHAASRRRLSEHEELLALHETALGLIERLDLESLLQAIVERACALVDTEHGYLYLADRDEPALTVRVGSGIFADRVGLRLFAGEGLAGRVWVTGDPLVVDDYRSWEGRQRRFDSLPIHAVVGVPLRTGSGVVGVLGLVYLDPQRTFGEPEIALLTRLGQLASLALVNARLYAEAQDELIERQRAEEELLDTVTRLRRSEHELQRTYEEMIMHLGFAAEFRSSETGRHTERMSRYCDLLARRIGLDDERCELIRAASPLHDIGKIAVPDSILLKGGPLTVEERKLVEQHAEIGHSLLAGSSSELLQVAATIALTHHERVDGAGYPRGLAGESIPLEGRIAAIADVFDALTSDRVYRPAYSAAQAVEVMRQGRGTQFDALVLDLFLDAIHELGEIEDARPPVDPREEQAEEATAGEPQAAAVRRVFDGIAEDVIAAACRSAEAVLRGGRDARPAVDRALEVLSADIGPALLSSVYLLDHDRLWCLAQHGYDEVRDGFTLEQGVMGRAMRSGEIQFLADVAEDPAFIAAAGGVASEVAVPFPVNGTPFGILNIETVGVALPPSAETAFVPLAQLIGRRVEEMRAELAPDLARLARLCVYASSLRGVGAISEFAGRTVGRLLELESVQVSLGVIVSGFRLASFWRMPESTLGPLPPAALELLAPMADATDSAYNVLESGDDGYRIIWLPLRVAGGRVGAVVGRAPRALSMEHEQVEAATLFVQHVAALIDVAQALRREQRAAVTDALTGLLNRRGFEERFREEFERARRAERELALVMLDCDDLKAINDRGGHGLGDAVLQLVGRCLKATKRLGDVAARLGGDEFVVLVPETDVDGALRFTERLLREIQSEARESGRGVTVSAGVASFPHDGATPEELLRAADCALYAAKGRGGDRIVRAEGVVSG